MISKEQLDEWHKDATISAMGLHNWLHAKRCLLLIAELERLLGRHCQGCYKPMFPDSMNCEGVK